MRLSARVIALAFVAALAAGPGGTRAGEPVGRLLSTAQKLDSLDEIAALRAIHAGLTEAGDGATFVWARPHGRLGGTVRPTSSFKDADGRVCRHLVVTLTSGARARTAEGIACREPDGSWALEG